MSESKFYHAGKNDFHSGVPFSVGDQLWEIFREDWRRGWSDAKRTSEEKSRRNDVNQSPNTGPD